MTMAEPTPKLTSHARLRCTQMRVQTKRVKRILSDPDLTYTSRSAQIAWRADDPAIAVVFVTHHQSGQRVALTVIWRTQEEYSREQ